MRGLQFLIGVALGLVLLAGCAAAPRDDLPDFGTGGDITSSTGDGGSGGLFSTGGSGDGGGPKCEKSCEPDVPAWFDGMSMFWIGLPAEALPCPDVAPIAGSVGYADLLVAPHACPACSCSPAACALPEAMHASAAKCANAGGAASIGWDASPAWEGVCTAEDAIPAGLACEGVPCVQSLTIEAPHIEPCKASAQSDPITVPESWGKIARECQIGPLSGEGCSTGEACVPAPPEGFALCVYRYGDHPNLDCPPAYPRRVDVFAAVDDMRACEPCTCSKPEGDCAALVSVYADGACGAVLGSYLLTSAMDEGCHDLPPGAALGSKEAVMTVDELGSCTPSGGAAVGAITPADPVVLCCTPEPEPAD